MKYKSSIAIAIMALALLTPSISFAAETKAADAANASSSNVHAIAVVDVQQVFEKSLAMGKIREQLDKKLEAYEKESSKKEEYFKKKFEELEKQKSVLSKESFEQKDGAVHKELAEVQKKFQGDQSTLEKAGNEAYQKVESALIEIVKEEAAKRGFKLVVQKAQIVYADDALDITAKVLESLNTKLPDVTVKFS